MHENYFLGVDGGGTQCRARLCDMAGAILGDGQAGPANLRFGLETGISAVLAATDQCLDSAGLSAYDATRIVACLALAGASEPAVLAAAQNRRYPFARTLVTSDMHAACIGAHGGRDGGVIIVGTGSGAFAQWQGRQYRIGGWGFPISDEGSGAWLGCEALRQVLWAHDARIDWTDMLVRLFNLFESDAHAVVRFMTRAKPKDFAAVAPVVVEHAMSQDPSATALMSLAASHVDDLASRLMAVGVERLSLMGGLAESIEPWLSPTTSAPLSPPRGDAVAGALQLARDLARRPNQRPGPG